jgi:uncharacterized protein (TIGR03437 family)
MSYVEVQVQRFLRSLLMFSVVAAAWAQTRPFTCNPAVPATPTIRFEGVTELTGDILITCTGGTPTAAGLPIPLTTLTLTLNARVTSRILSNDASEALILLDEPTNQSACTSPFAGCPVTGTGGVNLYDGSPGHPNIFQAQQTSPNTLTWDNLPLDAAGDNATHTIRITNVRANANAMAIASYVSVVEFLVGNSSAPQPFSIQATIAISSQLPIGLAAPTLIVANALPGIQVTMQGATLQQCGTSPLLSYPNAPSTATITLTEGFPGAFKQPSWATGTGGDTLASWIANGSTAESGFFPEPSSGALVSFGSSGTYVFSILLQNVPAGVGFSAPNSLNLLDPQSNVVGTVFAPPSEGNGPITTLLFNVISVTPTTALKSVTIPFTFYGSAPSLPLTISASAGFTVSTTPQNNLYEPTFIAAEILPIFGSLDTGIATPPENTAQPIATVINCTQTTPSLSTNGQALPVFQFTGPITPRVYNVPIISNGPPVSNLQIIKDPSATWLNATLSSTTTPATLLLSANAASANLQTTLQIATSAPIGTIALPVNFEYAPGPWFTRYGFANSASYVPQAVAPGEPFLIGGGNFASTTESNLTLGPNGFVTTSLGGVQVMFDSVPAPLQYTVNINGIGYVAGYVPFELAGHVTTNVEVIYNGTASPPVTLNVIDAVPAIFTVPTTGGGQGAILNQDFSLNAQGNGALPGDLVYIYGGGAGQTTPPGRTGGVTGSGAPVATLNLPVTVFIDGVQATTVPYAGPAPGLIEGVFQINVQIPPNARSGALPVVIAVGDKVTQPGVTVAVK